MSGASHSTSVSDAFDLILRECRPGRLIQEDEGVKGPLWFGRDPKSPWHVTANYLRLFFAIFLPPLFLAWPFLKEPWKEFFKRSTWDVEWSQVPDAILLEPPGGKRSEVPHGLGGQYAVTGNKPKWLLEVHLEGKNITLLRQVPYDGGHPDESALRPEELHLRKSIQRLGYTAVSYFMGSAKHVFTETGKQLDQESKKQDRGLSLRNRRLVAQTVLDCYAEARMTIPGKEDGIEYIWLDEFCLADAQLWEESRETDINMQRSLELGQLADIFRNARRVVVFCHEPKCDHMGIECPWGKRLFTIGEILYTPEVLQMTRWMGPEGKFFSSITILSGQEFRGGMQTRAAEAKRWHLYNIMQHSTNSGSVTWQSAIHSLVVEAIRRDEAEGFHLHNMLGKALNGLLPRRSQLGDLQGRDGWTDLAWLLELNQGFYNAALLAAVCKNADPWVTRYRWWGKPIAPREGQERLEPLATAVPAKFRNEKTNTLEPVLSIVGPKSVKLRHMLRRDGSGLYRHPDLKPLKTVLVAFVWTCISIVPILSGFSWQAAVGLLYGSTLCVSIIEILAGTIYVKKDGWAVLEDRLFQNNNPIPFLRSKDPSFAKTPEWGVCQLIPKWDPGEDNESRDVPRPYKITLLDLKTGVITKAVVTSQPNNMIILAVHGTGITCMLLDRDEDALEATIAKKVGMANVPPFVLAQAEISGTVYVGGGALCEKPVRHDATSGYTVTAGKTGVAQSPSSPSIPAPLNEKYDLPSSHPQSPGLLSPPTSPQHFPGVPLSISSSTLPSQSNTVVDMPQKTSQTSQTPLAGRDGPNESSVATLAGSVPDFGRVSVANAVPSAVPHDSCSRQEAPLEEFDPYQKGAYGEV